jgi:hypothetical protein
MSDTDPIDHYADVIDSRDIIARIEYLTELADAESPVQHVDLKCEHGPRERVECGECLSTWCDVCTGTHGPRCPFEYDHVETITDDERAELTLLTEVARQGESLTDWQYGETLVRESYFETYAQELHEDVSGNDTTSEWPYTCIDWEWAARELQMDYTSIDFDGITYYGRS